MNATAVSLLEGRSLPAMLPGIADMPIKHLLQTSYKLNPNDCSIQNTLEVTALAKD
jgi:hypothetical protein